jgi:hypothetical protein
MQVILKDHDTILMFCRNSLNHFVFTADLQCSLWDRNWKSKYLEFVLKELTSSQFCVPNAIYYNQQQLQHKVSIRFIMFVVVRRFYVLGSQWDLSILYPPSIYMCTWVMVPSHKRGVKLQSGYEKFRVLWYITVQTAESQSTFHRIISPPSSELKSRPSMKPPWSR